MTDVSIRSAEEQDGDGLWAILQPVFAAGETYAIDPDIDRAGALAYWTGGKKKVFVAERGGGDLLGTYYLVRNQGGGGAHVCNCGFVTAASAQGMGIARLMLEHAFGAAKEGGFAAMQFNFVISANTRAINLWTRYGFDTVGRLPDAFFHPHEGYVDALVMYRKL
ncbi:acetyltransferase [Roseibium aquae]|uniref:Acetyltransferase n=1 Tax=Roseibium aquae TaxID=1323746 RepID=A0A916TGM6_9HYPH|nr:N-acetyltransferase [Roseibium aquae]GGB44187.1 acetyltransferase [Roseibium aquae]